MVCLSVFSLSVHSLQSLWNPALNAGVNSTKIKSRIPQRLKTVD